MDYMLQNTNHEGSVSKTYKLSTIDAQMLSEIAKICGFRKPGGAGNTSQFLRALARGWFRVRWNEFQFIADDLFELDHRQWTEYATIGSVSDLDDAFGYQTGRRSDSESEKSEQALISTEVPAEFTTMSNTSPVPWDWSKMTGK